MTEPDPAEIDRVREHLVLRRRPVRQKLADAFADAGLPGIARRAVRHARRRIE